MKEGKKTILNNIQKWMLHNI